MYPSTSTTHQLQQPTQSVEQENVHRIRKADVHDRLAEALNKQFSTNLSGLQIKNKIANMRTTFSKAIKLKSMTGNGDKLGSTLRSRILGVCHFYDIMEPIWSKSWSINPRGVEGSGGSTDNGNVFDTIGKDSTDSEGEEKNKGAPEPAQQERVQVQESLQQQEIEMRHSTSTKPTKRKQGVAELMVQLNEITAGQTPVELRQLKLELEHDEKLHKIEAEKVIELAEKRIELVKIKLEKKKQKAQDKLCEFLMSSQELHVKKKKQRMGRDDQELQGRFHHR
ncbi:hypothetical protein BG011_001305 [Mortierella polycephala]|uniref:Uncharacterized protein n=1 Tax=Mortierella polycephala TaxID=41804 RepID=A0A9P6PKC9_9FUNG|nr:hypothetical protein BG011_001305 [Mortierella polycephala]